MLTRIFSRLLSASAIGLLFSCAAVTEQLEEPDAPVEYIIEAGCPETKTVYNGEHTSWADGDALSVFYSHNRKYEVSRFDYVDGSSFKGLVTDPDSGSEWYALYPWNASAKTPEQVNVLVDSAPSQDGNGDMGHLSGPCFPLLGVTGDVAEGDSPSFFMKHILSVVQFNITNKEDNPITITRIDFTAPVAITGRFSADLTASEPAWEPVSGAAFKTVSIIVNDGAPISKGEAASFYAGVMPFSQDGKYTLTVTAVSEEGQTVISEKTFSRAMNFGAAKINKLNYSFSVAAPAVQKAYVKVTGAPSSGMWDGKYLIANDGTGNNVKVLSVLEQGKQAVIDATEANGVIESNGTIDNYAFTFKCTGEVHPNNSSYYAHDLVNTNGVVVFYSQSMFRTAETHKVYNQDQKEYANYMHTVMYDNGGVQLMSSGNSGYNKYYLGYSNGSFKYEQSASGNRVQLYRLNDVEIVREDQSLYFVSTSINWKVGEEQDMQVGSCYEMPQTVNGAQTAVTYSSSNPEVAEVVGNSWIRINGAGTVTITATAVETASYNSNDARYSLTIEEIKPVEPVTGVHYVKVTESPGDEKWSGVYLVVSTDGTRAFSAFSGSSSYAIEVTDENGIIRATTETEKCELTISGGDVRHGNPTGNTLYAYDVKNTDEKYVYCSGSEIMIKDSNIGSYTYRHTFKYDGGAVQMRSSGTTNGNSQYYLTYSGGKFSYQKDNESNRVQLYLRVEGNVKKTQVLSFGSPSMTWSVGEEQPYSIGETYALPQTVSGAQTDVTYTTSDNSVAQIVDGTYIKLVAPGTVTITATAVETEEYKAASARFTLTIKESLAPGTEVDLHSFNLVNETISAYLVEAESKDTDDNWKEVTVIGNYPNGGGGDQGDRGPAYSYDRPAPVVIPLESYNNKTASVTVYEDSDRTKEELTVSGKVSNGKFEVYNLIPNRSYWFTATVDGDEVMNGTFETTGLRRYLKVSDICSADHANNLRDFGGMKVVSNGKVIGSLRYNRIFRGTNMDGTAGSSAEQAIITGYMGVRLDVDLRVKGSSSSSGAHQVLDRNLVSYNNNGFNSPNGITNDVIKKIVSDIIGHVSKGEACYIHCFAGADRTGFICMLIEAACGVSKKDCTIDYELTSFSCVGTRDRCGKADTYNYYKSALERIEGQSGSTFQEKATKLLLNAGITQQEIDALREEMIVLDSN